MPAPSSSFATSSPPKWEDTEPFEAPEAPRWEDTSPVSTTFADMDPYDPGAKEPWEMAAEEFSQTAKAQEKAAETPLVPPDAFKFLMEHTPNAYTLSKLLPVPDSVREGIEGFKDTLAEGAAGMTSPNSIAQLPAFAVPYVGPALAMGMGAKSIGEGAGKTVAAIEQGNPRDIGAGLGEVGFGAAMAVPGVMHSLGRTPPLIEDSARLPEPIGNLPEAPPIVDQSIAQGEQLGLTKSVEALKAMEKGDATVIEEPPPKPDTQPQTEGPPPPSKPTTTSAPPSDTAADTARFNELEAQVAEMRKTKSAMEVMSSPEYQAIATEQQAIKNKYQGQKPGDVPRGTQVEAPAESTLKKGDRVVTDDYGAGVVTAVLPNRVVVKFNEGDGKPFGVAKNKVRLAEIKTPIAETPPQAEGKMQAEVSSVAKTEGARDAADIKDELINEIQQKLAKAPAEAKAGEKVTIEIPGDGTFTVPNTVEALSGMLERARKIKTDAGKPPGVPKAAIKASANAIAKMATKKEQPVSMGGQNPKDVVEVPKAPLAQMTDALKTLAEKPKSSASEAFDLGKEVAEAKDRVSSAAEGLRAAGEYAKLKLEGKPVVTDWHRTLGQRHLELSESAVNARKFAKEAIKAIPDKLTREAISDWIDTGGDDALLARAATETKPGYKAGYEKAKALTPEQRTIAENLKNYFEHRLEDAQKAGILEDGIENYIHRLYEQESPFKKAVLAELRSGLFTGKPSLAKQRVFEYDFEAEKAGLKPIKDFVQRVAAYDLALNKAIADRRAVKSMMEIKMADGRPMIDVGGGGKVVETPSGEAEATFINRSAKTIDETDPKANRGDYKSYDHPALRKWKWAAEDSEGKPIFVQGDVLIHPDALRQMETLLGRSRIRANPVGRAALDLSSTIKQTMLDLSGFHQVQIAVHGMEHRTFSPVKEIDFTNPDVRGLIKGGAVVGETTGQHLFSEGLSGSSLTKHIPILGERIQAYQSYLFEDFIPRVKVAMGLHALERNRARFPKLSEPELYKMTAEQMNAAFGELNYEMMGRSKTVQDALRLTLLAPDFLEARSRFVAQAFTKYGKEQRQALVLGAATMFIFARIANKILDDEYHFEPKNWFNVVYKGKSYGLRTIQGDLIHMVTDPGKFTNHRLNPIYGKPLLEFATGRDYFGRKRDVGDKLKDIAMTPVPISVRGLTSGREMSILESFLNSFGFVTKRNSPASDISKLANEWREKNKVRAVPGEFIYDADKDPYRKIKLAAEYYDVPDVRSEIESALADGLTKPQIRKHFVLSANHRFTGSAANERKFVESLTADQKDMYHKALAERNKIKATVDAALR